MIKDNHKLAAGSVAGDHRLVHEKFPDVDIQVGGDARRGPGGLRRGRPLHHVRQHARACAARDGRAAPGAGEPVEIEQVGIILDVVAEHAATT